jgi:hypothetical protein
VTSPGGVLTVEPHQVKRYQPEPVRHPSLWRAYCTRPGCDWRWDGIGRFEHYRADHERLNDGLTGR